MISLLNLRYLSMNSGNGSIELVDTLAVSSKMSYFVFNGEIKRIIYYEVNRTENKKAPSPKGNDASPQATKVCGSVL